MTEIFYRSIAGLTPDQILSAKLPQGISAGSEKYTEPSAKAQSVAVRMLLSCALSQLGIDENAVTLAFTPEGKPQLHGVPLYVSLSHSQSYVAVALCEQPCGVDVEDETAVRHPHQLAKRFLDPATERQVRDADNPHLAFAIAFTRLEATVKQKEGVTLPFAKDHLTPIYYHTTLPLPDGKQAALTAVGEPPFRVHRLN